MKKANIIFPIFITSFLKRLADAMAVIEMRKFPVVFKKVNTHTQHKKEILLCTVSVVCHLTYIILNQYNTTSIPQNVVSEN